MASGWEGRGRVRGSTDQRLALTHPAFPFSHLLPFSSLHLSCLLVSTLSSGCRLVHTHRAHQPRHAGWPRRPGCAPACAPYTPSLPWTHACSSRAPFLHSHAEHLAHSPGCQHPGHPPCPAGPGGSREPQPWFLALTGLQRCRSGNPSSSLCTGEQVEADVGRPVSSRVGQGGRGNIYTGFPCKRTNVASLAGGLGQVI